MAGGDGGLAPRPRAAAGGAPRDRGEGPPPAGGRSLAGRGAGRAPVCRCRRRDAVSRHPVLHTALVLDDDGERRGEMCERLHDLHVSAEPAATLGEAIRKLTARRYELVLCDMVLCDPPGSPTPAIRGYLAVCYALPL